MTESCGNCRYFLANQNDDNMGWCRRLPPQVYMVSPPADGIAQVTGTSFPYMSAAVGWCGEHKIAGE